MSLPRVRRLAVAAGALVLTAAATSCTSGDAGSTGDKGYVVGDGTITLFEPADRDEAPTISGDAVGGGSVSLDDFAGRTVVINVWGSWCAPCRAEADDLVEASKQLPRAAFLGINTRDRESMAEAFEQAQGIPYDSIYDPAGKTLLEFYGLVNPASLPTTLVIDEQARIAAMVTGPVTASTLVGLVEDVRAES